MQAIDNPGSIAWSEMGLERYDGFREVCALGRH